MDNYLQSPTIPFIWAPKMKNEQNTHTESKGMLGAGGIIGNIRMFQLRLQNSGGDRLKESWTTYCPEARTRTAQSGFLSFAGNHFTCQNPTSTQPN